MRGCVCVQLNKEEMGNVNVNFKTCYDGDYFGELAHFEESETLTKEMIDQFNRQRTTCIAMENCEVLEINKVESHLAINNGLQGQFEDKIDFLRQIDIFSDIDMYILLPLASNIRTKKFKYGEYIAKAGERTEGLIIVKQGQCVVCAEKLAMRTTQPSAYSRILPKKCNIKTNPTGSS